MWANFRDSFSLDILNYLKVNVCKPCYQIKRFTICTFKDFYHFLAAFASFSLTLKLSSYRTIPLSVFQTSNIWNFVYCYLLDQKYSFFIWQIFICSFRCRLSLNLFEKYLSVYLSSWLISLSSTECVYPFVCVFHISL